MERKYCINYNHLGPYQQFTDVCMNCWNNTNEIIGYCRKHYHVGPERIDDDGSTYCGFCSITLSEPKVLDKTIGLNERIARHMVQLLIDKAKQLEYNAGMGGQHNDGGASKWLAMATGMLAVLDMKCPDDLEVCDIFAQARKRVEAELKEERRKADPEYKEFLRLKEKFGSLA